ncbi:hypothetical protein B0H19DRAFT_1065159 [Mycena capillaripes]|nr:hypothetical protein B0H19DRAFT_1065159 [Mycena capillaripes]
MQTAHKCEIKCEDGQKTKPDRYTLQNDPTTVSTTCSSHSKTGTGKTQRFFYQQDTLQSTHVEGNNAIISQCSGYAPDHGDTGHQPMRQLATAEALRPTVADDTTTRTLKRLLTGGRANLILDEATVSGNTLKIPSHTTAAADAPVLGEGNPSDTRLTLAPNYKYINCIMNKTPPVHAHADWDCWTQPARSHALGVCKLGFTMHANNRTKITRQGHSACPVHSPTARTALRAVFALMHVLCGSSNDYVEWAPGSSLITDNKLKTARRRSRLT